MGPAAAGDSATCCATITSLPVHQAIYRTVPFAVNEPKMWSRVRAAVDPPWAGPLVRIIPAYLPIPGRLTDETTYLHILVRRAREELSRLAWHRCCPRSSSHGKLCECVYHRHKKGAAASCGVPSCSRLSKLSIYLSTYLHGRTEYEFQPHLYRASRALAWMLPRCRTSEDGVCYRVLAVTLHTSGPRGSWAKGCSHRASTSRCHTWPTRSR